MTSRPKSVMTPSHFQTDPIAIADHIYWVGDRPPGQLLYCNSYLCRFPGDEPFHLLVDPASSCDFQVVLQKLEELLGDLDAVDAILLNHQDPDMSASVADLIKGPLGDRPVLCSDDTGELIHNYYDLSEEHFVSLEDYPSGLVLPSGDTVHPLFAPFGHHRGATMLFEPQRGVLFSGDLFSSLSNPHRVEEHHLAFQDDDRLGLRAFHQIHMPTREVMRQAIDAISDLPAPLQRIAPHHGGIIERDAFDAVFEELYDLPVGVDLLQQAPPDREDPRWGALWRSLTAESAEATAPAPPSMPSPTRQRFETALRQWTDALPTSATAVLQYDAIAGAHQLDLPTPRVTVDETRSKIPSQSGQHRSEDLFGAI